MLFAFLDKHLSNSSSSERARLDQRLYDKLSDLAATHQLLITVRSHRPLNTNRDISDVKRTEDRRAWKIITAADEQIKSRPNPLRITKLQMYENLKRFLNLTPPSGKQDQTWLERSEATRNALTALWSHIRKDKEQWLSRDVLSASELDAELSILRAGSDPQNLAAVEQERDRILSRLHGPRKEIVTTPVQSTWDSTIESRVSTLPIREQAKVKTRPDLPAAANTDAETEYSSPADSASDGAKIRVRQQTMETFSHMFPTDANEGTKTVEWNAFVQAMADAGFLARHCGGSAVVFEQENVGGRIVFHKPHPVPKIDPIMFRCMGRRMSKWFNWNRHTFYVE